MVFYNENTGEEKTIKSVLERYDMDSDTTLIDNGTLAKFIVDCFKGNWCGREK